MYQAFSDNRKVHPRETANVFSILTFFYTISDFIKGFKKDYDEEDLYDVVTCCKSTSVADRVEKQWNLELTKEKPSIVRVIFKVFGKEYMILGLINFVFKTILLVARPILLGKLVKYFTPEQAEVSRKEAYIYASSVIAVTIFSSVYLHGYMFYINQLGMKIRIAFCSLIYRKSLKLTPTAINEITNGKIVTLISKDVYSIDAAIMFLHDMWAGIFHIFIMTYIMYEQIGWSSVAGTGFLIMLVPIQVYFGNRVQSTRLKTAAKTDERVRLIKEILMSIKIIKMYVWETFFAEKTSSQRKSEMKMVRLIFYMKTLIFSMGSLSTRLSFYLCILVFTSYNNVLTAEKAFIVIGCYAALRSVITISIPIGLSQIAEAKSSFIRIRTVLMAEEMTNVKLSHPDTPPKIEVNNCTINIGDKNVLKIPNFYAKDGLIGLTGPVGSGKSTLLKSILQDTEIRAGTIDVSGRMSYASQEPWLFPGTIKQNIIFGEYLDEKRYQKVIRMCALTTDLSNFRGGDSFVVMDKGSNLSKGQQTRINLARAIYREADIYLLDDSLSSLDAHVCRYIFNNVIKEFLAGKIVIFVSHQKQFLKEANRILILGKGCIEKDVDGHEIDSLKLDNVALETEEDSFDIPLGSVSKIAYNYEDDEEVRLLHQSNYGIYHEKKKEGIVEFSIYQEYLKSGGGALIIIFIISMFLAAQISSSWFDMFISKWVDSEHKLASFEMKNLTDNTTYIELKKTHSNSLTIYSILISCATIFQLLQSFSLFYSTSRASINLHKKTFSKVIQASMSFFDFHLVGNILNRFSKDVGLIDEFLPFVIFETIRVTFIVSGIIFVICSVNLSFLPVSAVMMSVLYLLKVVYIPTGRSLKRLDNSTRSPVIGHINSSLEGLSTIRASKAQGVLKIQFDRHQDLNTSASYMYMTQSRAFGFFLDMLCGIFIAIIVLTFLFWDTNALAGKVGLAITQAFALTGLLQWGIRQWAELENCMTSVERLVEYSKTNIEEKITESDSSWPENGEIEFQNVEMQYIKSVEPVLKNINLHVQPKEKIGIIGRTGAGKSSLISALFKLYDVKGAICIDRKDIKRISFDNLRRKISIIPQDPLLFVGTLRSNLDPYGEFTDEQLWDALKAVDLKPLVESLEMLINDGGTNFSAGQKQLVCLARAILRNNKILVLDEATANVDPETDNLIQQAIKNKFSNCTILIVAHKLDNILDCDKILVMSKGTIVEYNTPAKLLENPNGAFYGMVKQAGLLKENNKEI